MSFKKYNFNQLVKELNKYNYKQLHIHHTWKPDHSNFNGSNHDKVQQGMKDYHVNNLGWRDIGQNVSLFPDGVWVEGRHFNQTPASIQGWNTGAFAVEMVGNFDAGNDKLKGRQRNEILKLVNYFINKYGEQSIKFHRENSNKSCPGTGISKEELIRESKQLGEGGSVMDKNDVKKIVASELDRSNQNVSDWAKEEWQEGIKLGITDGTKPRSFATREEVNSMIIRALNLK